ncbi:UpxY family transcription antiterminator [Zunongwangia endophytica]|uniref:UpxY family transcription antiterminator n=1 Tax=Zunongwangia endophytica TaxID=1808945 RepID=A0ABV8HB49_9FLAO|nr:UpxY family transcription antiterminator [Zunongwangia endophytica]MDN3596233.1 UpxY family transcription antiterminator [Zunongwangia endophytica]
MPWYVIITKPKSEIRTSEILENMGVEVFCPVIEEVRQWSDRKKKFIVPLFRGYIFVKLLDKERSVVFEVSGVLKYLFWLGKPATVHQKEIEVIKEWLCNETINNIKVSQFKPGESINIKNGAFKNKKAVIQEISKTKLKLVLPNFGIFLTADINELI